MVSGIFILNYKKSDFESLPFFFKIAVLEIKHFLEILSGLFFFMN